MVCLNFRPTKNFRLLFCTPVHATSVQDCSILNCHRAIVNHHSSLENECCFACFTLLVPSNGEYKKVEYLPPVICGSLYIRNVTAISPFVPVMGEEHGKRYTFSSWLQPKNFNLIFSRALLIRRFLLILTSNIIRSDSKWFSLSTKVSSLVIKTS